MNARNLLGTAVCAILTWAAGSAAALGQNEPAGCPLLTSPGEDSAQQYSQTVAESAQSAGCCDEGCCPPCFCPRWTASADFIILDRLGGANQVLVSRVPTVPDAFTMPGVETFNSSDFQQGFCGGPRLGLIRHGDGGYDWELSYFQIDGWNSDRVITPDSPTQVLVMKSAVNFVQTTQVPNQAMAWDYATKLYNAECNVRWNPDPRVTALAGFRWINLGENLDGTLFPPVPSWEPPFWNTTTTNNLFGFQIGADGKLWERDRFSINGLAKAGVFDNFAEQTTSVSVIAKQVRTGSDSSTHAAFVGETGLQGKYQVTNALALRAGYEVIWLEGVALAPGQIQETSVDLVPKAVHAIGVNCNSGAFYHGATVGLEYAF